MESSVFLNFDTKKAPVTQVSTGPSSKNLKLQFMETSGIIHSIPADVHSKMDTIIDKLAKLMKCKKEQMTISFNGSPIDPQETVQQLNIDSSDILVVKTSISFDTAPVRNNYVISENSTTFSAISNHAIPKFDFTSTSSASGSAYNISSNSSANYRDW